jgi:hypothetical protein
VKEGEGGKGGVQIPDSSQQGSVGDNMRPISSYVVPGRLYVVSGRIHKAS